MTGAIMWIDIKVHLIIALMESPTHNNGQHALSLQEWKVKKHSASEIAFALMILMK